MTYTAVRSAIQFEINIITKELARLTKLLAGLDRDGNGTVVSRGQAERKPRAQTSKAPRRLRLAEDTRNNIIEKIVKAVKAHKGGASKQDIIKYLKTSGYTLGTNYNEQHLFAILSSLRGEEGAQITTTGQKSKMRYHAA